MNTTEELKIRHQLATVDTIRDMSPYQGAQLPAAQDYQLTARDVAYALHMATLAGNMSIDFGFPRDMPPACIEGYLSKARYLLDRAGLQAPLTVRPVQIRESRRVRREPRGFKRD